MTVTAAEKRERRAEDRAPGKGTLKSGSQEVKGKGEAAGRTSGRPQHCRSCGVQFQNTQKNFLRKSLD